MVAPTLTSEHPGLEVLAEVAKVLAAGRPAEEGLADVVGVLQRGLALRRCHIWLRSVDGSRFLPIVGPDGEAPLRSDTVPVAARVAAGPHEESAPGRALLGRPLVHDDEAPRRAEGTIAPGPLATQASAVAAVAAP